MRGLSRGWTTTPATPALTAPGSVTRLVETVRFRRFKRKYLRIMNISGVVISVRSRGGWIVTPATQALTVPDPTPSGIRTKFKLCPSEFRRLETSPHIYIYIYIYTYIYPHICIYIYIYMYISKATTWLPQKPSSCLKAFSSRCGVHLCLHLFVSVYLCLS